MIKIGVGSANTAKVAAVLKATEEYTCLAGAMVSSVPVSTTVPPQPMSLDVTTYGASQRALQAYAGQDYGFGIESGFIELGSKDFMDVCICAIQYPGGQSIDMSSGLLVPRTLVGHIIYDGEPDLAHAMVRSGWNATVLEAQTTGFTSRLTGNRVDRLQHVYEAIVMAMTKIEHPELYK